MNNDNDLHLVDIKKSLTRHRPSKIQDTLRDLRVRRNFTQTELATRLRVSTTTVSNYETRMRKCPAHVIEAWAKECGFIISFIIEEATDEAKEAMDATPDAAQDDE